MILILGVYKKDSMNNFTQSSSTLLPYFDGNGIQYKYTTTRKMVPITGRARSFLLVFKN